MSLIKKALYIKRNIDEKRSCAMLERCTRQMPYPVSFTVTTNCFTGLECTEHTYFDLIIAENDFPDFCLLDMKKVLRAVGNKTALILLESEDYPRPELYYEFNGVLREPFTSSDLCITIEDVLSNPHKLNPVKRVAQASVCSISSTDNETNGTVAIDVDEAIGAAVEDHIRRTRCPQLETVDEELPTNFDTQMTFGIEGVHSLLPPTIEDCSTQSSDGDEQETINTLSRLSKTSIPSDTNFNLGRRPVARGKLDAIQGLFNGKLNNNNGSNNNSATAGHINGLLEKMNTNMFHHPESISSMQSTALPNNLEIRQLHMDFDFEMQTQKKRGLETSK